MSNRTDTLAASPCIMPKNTVSTDPMNLYLVMKCTTWDIGTYNYQVDSVPLLSSVVCIDFGAETSSSVAFFLLLSRNSQSLAYFRKT